MQEVWVQSLGQEDPLEEDMTTHSSIFLPAESHGQRSLASYRPWCHKESYMTGATWHACLLKCLSKIFDTEILDKIQFPYFAFFSPEKS